MKRLFCYLSATMIAVLLTSCFQNRSSSNWESTSAKIASDDVDINKLPKETFKIVSPPFAPPAIERREPARVAIELEVREVVKKLSDGVDYTYWTFGGTVPGPIRNVRRPVPFSLMT